MEVKPSLTRIMRVRGSRGANWTEKEKLVLVQTILQHEHELFGKGFHRNWSSKQKYWQEVCESVNSELQIYRTVKQIRKTYDNLKWKAKHKLDEARRIQVCGGVAPAIKELSIKLLMDHMDSKQGVCGSPVLHMEQDTDHSMENSWETSPVEEPAGEPTPLSIQYSDQEESTGNHDNFNSYQDELLALETEKVRAEIQKLHKETELIEKRKEQEEEIFMLKKKVLLAKLKHYSSSGQV